MLVFQETWWAWNIKRSKIELNVIGFFPIRPEGQGARSDEQNSMGKFIAPGIAPSFQMAVDAVNKNSSILRGYRINPIVFNGACEPDWIMVKFIKVITHFTLKNGMKKTIGIIGPACSDTVVPLAGVSKYYNLPIISYGAEGGIFTDQNVYPHFFRTIPENKIFKNVYLDLFEEFGWKRIGSLTEDGQRYSEYITPLHELLEVS